MRFSMKLSILIFGLPVLLVAAGNSYAQGSAPSSASATILAPVIIHKTEDMDFGALKVGPDGGSVVISPSGGKKTSGGVSSDDTTGGGAASFTVGGQGGFTYSISLPSDTVKLDDSSEANFIVVSDFTSIPVIDDVLNTGTQEVSVGATLTVPGSETTGSYSTEIPFDVKLSYNFKEELPADVPEHIKFSSRNYVIR